ncbi:MAG TPA: histidine phosphatase family protein [Dehalococcoidia bacterium]|nr:histidine phosphatase family protein [Dehalococcoidia bacterium]
MVEIILARHGETDWNASEIFRGRADVPLNEVGRKQAEMLGEYLGRVKTDFIYSSPLKRAIETAGVIAGRCGLEVNPVENLNDFHFGDWQGLSHRQVQEQYPELYRDWLDTPEQVRIPGGESLEDVRSRAVPFVDDAVMRCGEGRIVFVSHRVVHKVLVCSLLGLNLSHFWNIRIDTCGVTRFDCGDGRLVLNGHNDTSFLHSVSKEPAADF